MQFSEIGLVNQLLYIIMYLFFFYLHPATWGQKSFLMLFVQKMIMEKQGQREYRCSDGQESPAATLREDVNEDSQHGSLLI